MSATNVTVLGLGAMGRAAAAVLAGGGVPVTAWNRTVRPGVPDGVRVAPSVVEAVADAPLVLVSVTDQAAATEVLAAVGDAVRGRVVVNLTTGTPAETAALAADLAGRGATYVGGVVQAQPEQLGTAAATLLVAGDAEALERHRPALDLLGAVVRVGDDPERAGRYDLTLMGLWYDVQLAVFAAFELAGGDPETFVPFARRQLGFVVDSLPGVARELRVGAYPRGPATLVEHARVLAQLVELRAAHGLDTSALERADAAARRLIEAGHGEDGFTRLAAS